ncbi:MAG TPA: hypothetical protein VFS23_35960 [Vicinamibacterales bacterium]|nr:hypothetical protein [Vicinamibacterales bacterium]
MTQIFSRGLTTWLAAASLSVATIAAAGQQTTVVVNNDDITIRGCAGRASPGAAERMMVWTRGDIMLSNPSGLRSGQLADRVFYWLDDDEDLSKYVGQMIEIKGDLGDFEKGEVEFDRDGDFTDIKLKLDGKTEKARVPTSWLGGAARGEGDVDIIARKIDVDDVKVLGACPAR